MSPVSSKKNEGIGEAGQLLVDHTRLQIYRAVVEAAAAGMTTAQAAARFSVHRNVARMHLEKLAKVGMLVSTFRKADGGGRPARVYYMGETVTRQYPPRDYQLLAHISLTALEQGADPRQIARRAGRQVGERALLAAGLEPGNANRAKLIASLRRVAEEHGIFARIQVADEGQLEVTALNCIFRELAIGHARTVCGLHTQLLMGMFESHLGKIRIRKGKLELAEGGMSCKFSVISAS